jgi:hypothetical protein
MKNVMEKRRKVLCSLTILWFLLCCAIINGNAQTPEQIARNALNSTVILTTTIGRNSQGSGFFVGDGVIVTNHHVIKGATAATVKLVGTEQETDIEGYIAIDEARDLAILKVANLHAPPLPLGNSDTVQVAETVYAVGNPRGLEGTVSEGIISNIQPDGNSGIRGEVIQMTAPISEGSSGGAVLNSRGEVIGIAASVRNDGQNLNFAIPVNALKALLNRAEPVRPLVAEPSDAKQNTLANLLNLIILGLTVFGVIHFLPTVNANGWITAAGVAVGFGVIKVVGIGVMTNPALPKGVDIFLTAPPPNDIVHALNCANCFPKLLVYLIKLPAYITITAFLLGIANKAVPTFELNGFFNTYLVALLIIVIEGVLHSFIPIL